MYIFTNITIVICAIIQISQKLCKPLNDTQQKWYNIITVKNERGEKVNDLIKKLEQLEQTLKRIDKLFYRLIQIAGTIGILITAIKSWFN